MRDLSRAQLLLYGAVAAALLVVGFRWVGASGGDGDSQAANFDSAGSAGSRSGTGSASFSAGGSNEDVVVDVAGEVGRPGVYRMPAGSRVNDAVTRAGGASGAANLEAINLAARLSDGQQVVVPAKATGAASAASAAGATATGPISLGSATVADLDTIEGIGPVTAQKIVEFRDQHGGVSSIDELSQISGIGPATMEALRARLQP